MIPKIVCISDLHFGHLRVPSKDTASDIRMHLFPYLDATVDILFIAGDVYDRLISMNQYDSITVFELFTDIFKLCNEYDITLRIIRGTFSHDHRQVQFIDTLYKKIGIPLNYRSFDELFIEYMEKFDIHVLYIPDNLPFPTKNDIFDQINIFMKALNITAVDYVVMHGELNHLVFGHVNINAFTAADFEKICRRFVFSGHIHKPLLYKNTISIGSFNRLAHNEEEHKGFWVIQEKPVFVPNKTATIFKTLNFTSIETVEDLLEQYNNAIKSFDNTRLAFVRVIIRDVHLKHTLSRYNDTNHQNIRLTFKASPVRDAGNTDFIQEKLARKQDMHLEVPSLENISTIVFNDLQEKGIFIDITDIRSIILDDALKGG